MNRPKSIHNVLLLERIKRQVIATPTREVYRMLVYHLYKEHTERIADLEENLESLEYGIKMEFPDIRESQQLRRKSSMLEESLKKSQRYLEMEEDISRVLKEINYWLKYQSAYFLSLTTGSPSSELLNVQALIKMKEDELALWEGIKVEKAEVDQHDEILRKAKDQIEEHMAYQLLAPPQQEEEKDQVLPSTVAMSSRKEPEKLDLRTPINMKTKYSSPTKLESDKVRNLIQKTAENKLNMAINLTIRTSPFSDGKSNDSLKYSPSPASQQLPKIPANLFGNEREESSVGAILKRLHDRRNYISSRLEDYGIQIPSITTAPSTAPPPESRPQDSSSKNVHRMDSSSSKKYQINDYYDPFTKKDE